MKMRNVRVSFTALICLFMISACASPGPKTLKLQYQPMTDTESALSSLSPKKFKVLPFVDKREQNVEPILIGRRQAAFNVPMGEVYSDKPIFELLRDAIETELIRCGHTVVTENEDVALGGEIRVFWVGTDVTALYWDVIGEVSIVMDVKRAGDTSTVQFGPYGGKQVKRTYSNPSVPIMEGVLGGSLQETITSMSSDSAFLEALK